MAGKECETCSYSRRKRNAHNVSDVSDFVSWGSEELSETPEKGGLREEQPAVRIRQASAQGEGKSRVFKTTIGHQENNKTLNN